MLSSTKLPAVKGRQSGSGVVVEVVVVVVVVFVVVVVVVLVQVGSGTGSALQGAIDAWVLSSIHRNDMHP